jgi:hypothetical protein
VSYGIRDGQYIPVGSTAEALPPGYYTVVDPDYGPPYFQPRAVKTDELLDVPGTAADDIALDIKGFLARRAEYETYGFTHKRGYLLYGPPGTGKSSIAQLTAKRFIADGGVVVVCQAHELPLAVSLFAKTEPTRSLMVLMEDPNEAHLNSGDVLSILDGATPVAGLVTVVTTNYKSKMPPRLANRPGRFDRVVLVDRIDASIQKAFLEQLQGRVPGGPKPADAIIAALDGLPLTLAHLKEAFVSHVVLGTSLPDLRTRFETMASTANDDDGTVAPQPTPQNIFAAIAKLPRTAPWT